MASLDWIRFESISMMFLKWGQSDQSVPIGSNYSFLQGNLKYILKFVYLILKSIKSN